MDTVSAQQWQQLLAAAKESYEKAYAPYSNFHVGAALLTSEGDVFQGCNVENASYGLTVCAERNCIANAVVAGKRSITCIVVYTEQEKLTPPCGACRQVIAEFMTQGALVYSVNHLGDEQQWTVAELLPSAFLPDNLNKEN